MSLETASPKQLNELEHCVRELLGAMRKAKMMDEPLVETLKVLEQKLGESRRERFDAVNQEFKGY